MSEQSLDLLRPQLCHIVSVTLQKGGYKENINGIDSLKIDRNQILSVMVVCFIILKQAAFRIRDHLIRIRPKIEKIPTFLYNFFSSDYQKNDFYDIL